MRWGPPPPPRGGGGGGYNIFGLLIPAPVAWLIALVLFMSAVGSLLERMGVPILTYSLLTTPQVWKGEIWRLVTWAPLELRPLSLLFGCVAMYFFCPDLVYRWGVRRFFINFFGGAAIVGAVTCLVAQFAWREVALVPHMGLWPMQEAMIIAWSALFPTRQILVYFVIPIGGRHLIAITIAITVVLALLNGFFIFVPHFVAEFLALVYMDVFSFRRLYLRGRMAMLQRDYKRRTAHLHVIDRDRDEPPRWTH